ncbi:small ribosomal subunit protein cS23-like [Wolffia australiana]
MMCASLARALPAVGPASQCSIAPRSPLRTLPNAATFFTSPRPFTNGNLVFKNPRTVSPLAAAAAVEAEELAPEVAFLEDADKESLEAAAKEAAGKPRLVLKFVWMDKNIGLALDHVIPGHGAVPLSPYYFWPRKDAWEELKTLLESKPWISQKRMIILLNQATDIINLWQQSGAGSLQQ